MPDITKILVTSVLKDQIMIGGVAVRVYPGHMTGVKNPIYPCITLNKKGETRPDQIADDEKLFLSVWSKVGNDELWDVFNQVDNLLNLKSIPAITASNGHSILLMRKIYVKDDLYEADTYTYQLATRYKVDII